MKLDHLLYTVPDLRAGIDELARLLGVDPTLGGRHPDLGTANALVGMGPDTYLEIIGPDPATDDGNSREFLGMDFSTPRLGTWVAKATLAADTGTDLPSVFGSIRPGQRDTPSGDRLTWLFSDPFEPRFGGVIPVLVDWQDSPHPASSLDPHCQLLGLRLEHPTPKAVEEAVGDFEGGFHVMVGDRSRLVATIDTPNGVIELR